MSCDQKRHRTHPPSRRCCGDASRQIRRIRTVNQRGVQSFGTCFEGSDRFVLPRRKRAAFSLVELIVVMVILGMLAGMVAVRTRGYLVNSRKNAVKTEIATILKALETFRIDQARFPTEDEGLEILSQPTDTWEEGFLSKVPQDPWKNPYLYFVTDDGIEVVSLGADGREGGDGEDADFSSTMLEE